MISPESPDLGQRQGNWRRSGLNGWPRSELKLSPDLHLDQVGFAAGRLEGAALAGEARQLARQQARLHSLGAAARLVPGYTITHKITSATPRLFKKYNFKAEYIDGSTGPANLPLENYASGPTAPYNSWCLLEKDEAAE